MPRKLIIAASVLAAILAGAFWFLTIPKMVSGKELGPHTANLENGRVLFHAGGDQGSSGALVELIPSE